LPGLLALIGERYGVELAETYMVGDSPRDLQAGFAAGCAPHLVRTGKGARLDAAALDALADEIPHFVVHADLAAFAQQLILRERQQRGDDAAEADSVFAPLQ
jgi:D-glycero-D-manno-heptose 1,7-bisphosphate phosphatase